MTAAEFKYEIGESCDMGIATNCLQLALVKINQAILVNALMGDINILLKYFTERLEASIYLSPLHINTSSAEKEYLCNLNVVPVSPDRHMEMSRGSAHPARLSIYLLLISRLSPIFTLGVFPLTCPVCSPVLPPAHPLPLFALCSWCSAAPAGYFCQQSSAWS